MDSGVCKLATCNLLPLFMIGVISDTHDLLRPEAIEHLQGCDLIIHGGDVNSQDILDQLAEIAPVKVVRGNVDRGSFGDSLPLSEVIEYAGRFIYVIHDIGDLQIDPKAAGFRMVIYGHSHIPKIEHREGTIFFNPGSAGRRRFKLPITAGRIHVIDGDLVPEYSSLLTEG